MSKSWKSDYIDTRLLYVIMLVMLLSGAADTIILKMIVESRDDHDKKFKHPYITGGIAFLGGSFDLIIHAFFMGYQVKQYGGYEELPDVKLAVSKGKKPSIAFYWLTIPALGNIFAIPLMNLGISMVDASVFQMMRGFLIFLTAILSIMFLKSTFYRHHWLAIFLIVTGVATVGLSSIKNSKESENVTLGIALILLSQLFTATHLVIEEKILHTHYGHPLKLVGIEGIIGLVIMTICIIIMQYIPCNGKLCPNGGLDNAQVALDQIKDNHMILIYGAIMSGTICTFQTSGVGITKYGSSTHRSSIDISRIIVIWIFFLLYQGNGHEEFQVLQLIGFLIILVGTILYNEIYVPPIFSLNKFTKLKLKNYELSDSLTNSKIDEINASQSYTSGSSNINRRD